MTSRVLELSVPTPSGGERLDRFLAAAQADLSRSRLQQLIREGRVRVNGMRARASHRLRDGDRISVEIEEPQATTLEPEDLPVVLVYEDPDLVVVDKPAGLVVHPGAGVTSGTLVHRLLHRFPEIGGIGGPARPGIVHRLDKETSGLMVIARTARAHRALVEAIRARSVRRGYLALVWGDPRAAEGAVSTRIGRDPTERKRMAVLERGGKEARTRWRVIERFGVAAALEVELETGRTHQIRVHLMHIRHPVVGDPTYGGRGKKLLSLPVGQRNLAQALLLCLRRQALHAGSLQLSHPVTGRALSFQSAVPEDLSRALTMLRDAGPHHGRN
jgi:23S rRNA pseudouridine1911/1915/1917 synthase